MAVKIACRHADRRATDLLMREIAGVGLGAPPGFCAFAGTRPKSSPVIRLFSVLVDRKLVDIQVHTAGQSIPFKMDLSAELLTATKVVGSVGKLPELPDTDANLVEVPLRS